MMSGGRGGMARQASPPGYAAGGPIDPYHNAPRSAPNPIMSMDGLNPAQRAVVQHQDEYAAGPAGAIGQAIEMDERTGSPPDPMSARAQDNGHARPSGEHYGLRDSDGDVAGMVGLRQGHAQDPRMIRTESERSDVRSLDSVYSDQ